MSRCWFAIVCAVLAVINPCVCTTSRTSIYDLDICFVCDEACTKALVGRWGPDGVNTFLNASVVGAAKLLKTLDKEIDARMHLVVTTTVDVELAWFNGNDHSKGALNSGNMGLWGQMTGLFASAKENGCDIAFAVFPGRTEHAFQFSSLDGIANMYQVCSLLGFSTIKLYQSNLYEQIILLAHETGHLLGLYHDLSVNDNLKPLAGMGGDYPQLIASLNVCEEENSGCNVTVAGGPDRCVMHPMPTVGHVYPTEFSDCSKAYFNVYKQLSTQFPAIYNRNCFMPPGSSRPTEAVKLATDDQQATDEVFQPTAGETTEPTE